MIHSAIFSSKLFFSESYASMFEKEIKYENNSHGYKHNFSTKYMDVPNPILIGKQFWDFLGISLSDLC